MLMYTTIGTDDLPSMTRFYDAIFAVLGVPRIPAWSETWAMWGEPPDQGFSFCICPPFDKKGPRRVTGRCSPSGQAAQSR